MTNDITAKFEQNKKKKVHQSQTTGIAINKPVKIIIFFFLVLFLIGSISIIITLKLRSQSAIGGFQWCRSGNVFKLADTTLTAVGLEDYKSSQYEDKVCHLRYNKDDRSSELYLDEIALVNFNNNKKDQGNGCVVYVIEKSQRTNELCFGSKIKETAKITPSISSVNIDQNQTSSVVNLSGTTWRYSIDVGGGVGGVMTFTKDEGGSLSGTFTEFGPEGKEEKSFVGSFEKDNFLLTLEEFPTFKMILSSDGKTMIGKPVEEDSSGIEIPDDFFKATLETQSGSNQNFF